MAAVSERTAANVIDQIRTLVYTKKNSRAIVEELRLLALHPPNAAIFDMLLAALRQLKPQKSEGEENKAIRTIYQYLSMLVCNGGIEESSAVVAMHALASGARDMELPASALAALQLYSELAVYAPTSDASSGAVTLLSPMLTEAAQAVGEATAAYLASSGTSGEFAGLSSKVRKGRALQLWVAPHAYACLATLAGTLLQPHGLIANHIRVGLCSRDGDVSRAAACALLRAALRARGPGADADRVRYERETAAHVAATVAATVGGGKVKGDQGSQLGGLFGKMGKGAVFGGGASLPSSRDSGREGGMLEARPDPPLTSSRLREIIVDTAPGAWQGRAGMGDGGNGSGSLPSASGNTGSYTHSPGGASAQVQSAGQPGFCVLDTIACVDFLRACAVVSCGAGAGAYGDLADDVDGKGKGEDGDGRGGSRRGRVRVFDPLTCAHGGGGCTGDTARLLAAMHEESGPPRARDGTSAAPAPSHAEAWSLPRVIAVQAALLSQAESALHGAESPDFIACQGPPSALSVVPPYTRSLHPIDASAGSAITYSVLVGALSDGRPRVRLEAAKLLAGGGVPRMLSAAAASVQPLPPPYGYTNSPVAAHEAGCVHARRVSAIFLAVCVTVTQALHSAVRSGSPILACSALRSAATVGASFSAWEAHTLRRADMAWARGTALSRGGAVVGRYAGYRGRVGMPLHRPGLLPAPDCMPTSHPDLLLSEGVLRVWAACGEGMTSLVDAIALVVGQGDAVDGGEGEGSGPSCACPHVTQLALCALSWCCPALAHAVPAHTPLLDPESALLFTQRLLGVAARHSNSVHAGAATTLLEALFPSSSPLGAALWTSFSACSRITWSLLCDTPRRLEEGACERVWASASDRAVLYRAATQGYAPLVAAVTVLPALWLRHMMGVASVWGAGLASCEVGWGVLRRGMGGGKYLSGRAGSGGTDRRGSRPVSRAGGPALSPSPSRAMPVPVLLAMAGRMDRAALHAGRAGGSLAALPPLQAAVGRRLLMAAWKVAFALSLLPSSTPRAGAGAGVGSPGHMRSGSGRVGGASGGTAGATAGSEGDGRGGSLPPPSSFDPFAQQTSSASPGAIVPLPLQCKREDVLRACACVHALLLLSPVQPALDVVLSIPRAHAFTQHALDTCARMLRQREDAGPAAARLAGALYALASVPRGKAAVRAALARALASNNGYFSAWPTSSRLHPSAVVAVEQRGWRSAIGNGGLSASGAEAGSVVNGSITRVPPPFVSLSAVGGVSPLPTPHDMYGRDGGAQGGGGDARTGAGLGVMPAGIGLTIGGVEPSLTLTSAGMGMGRLSPDLILGYEAHVLRAQVALATAAQGRGRGQAYGASALARLPELSMLHPRLVCAPQYDTLRRPVLGVDAPVHEELPPRMRTQATPSARVRVRVRKGDAGHPGAFLLLTSSAS